MPSFSTMSCPTASHSVPSSLRRSAQRSFLVFLEDTLRLSRRIARIFFSSLCKTTRFQSMSGKLLRKESENVCWFSNGGGTSRESRNVSKRHLFTSGKTSVIGFDSKKCLPSVLTDTPGATPARGGGPPWTTQTTSALGSINYVFLVLHETVGHLGGEERAYNYRVCVFTLLGKAIAE
jgi:hypothetical protein